jgi:ribosomal protein S18 acetylase RimI-like enzyme
MTNFVPGTKVYQDENGVEIRYPSWGDLDLIVCYVNKISSEDTFILMSGEVITKQEEAKYLADVFWNIESNNGLFLLLFVDGKLCGIADIVRDFKKRRRSLHFGIMGISLDNSMRGRGFGFLLSSHIIKEAKAKLYNLKAIELDVFANNQVAQNLYKKLGFTEVGRVPNKFLHKGHYIDQIIMTLEV